MFLGHQVLIVDDDPVVQKLLKTVLELSHFEVAIASNGAEALECIEQTRPALVVLDIMMPMMDGPTFLLELERRGWRASLPVIVLTANIHAKPLIEHMGVDISLSKPFRLAELVQHIRGLVKRYHGGASANK